MTAANASVSRRTGRALPIAEGFAAAVAAALPWSTSATGILIYFATSLISHLLLRKWHESAVRREN